MPDGLYERDALTWAETQAALLRRLAAGEGVNAQIDWPHVIEEVQDVGLSELRACRSLLSQALRYLLKLRAWPHNPAANHWRSETRAFLVDAWRDYTPSMRQRLDVPALYAEALFVVRPMVDEFGPASPLPDVCPFTLDDVLAGELDALLARFSLPSAAAPP